MPSTPPHGVCSVPGVSPGFTVMVASHPGPVTLTLGVQKWAEGSCRIRVGDTEVRALDGVDLDQHIAEVLDAVTRAARITVDALVLAPAVYIHGVVDAEPRVRFSAVGEDRFCLDFTDHSALILSPNRVEEEPTAVGTTTGIATAFTSPGTSVMV